MGDDKTAMLPVHPSLVLIPSCWHHPSTDHVLQTLPVIPGMFITESYNSCIVCRVIMWQSEC